MRVFYGAAIQGHRNRAERMRVHRTLIDCIASLGFRVVCEHTSGSDLEECAQLLENGVGPLPPPGPQRTRAIRDRMIELVEGDIHAAVFEVSTPSLGTGVEFAHAYLRPRLGLPEIPVLALYERDYWPNGLSTMIRGVQQERFPSVTVAEYRDTEEACETVRAFLRDLSSPA